MTRLSRTVALIGMMGAGKSSVGRRLAARLDVPFRDADHEIEMAAGCSIAQIFERYGEPAFREGERKIISRLLAEPPHVLATGGGAFIDPDTRAKLKESATTVWIKAPVEILLARVQRRDHRPLLQGGNAQEIMGRLLTERAPIYALADLTVESADLPHNVTMSRILGSLKALGVCTAP